MLRYPSRRLCRFLSLTKISLYIHIPFCVRKCLYCDFLSFYASDDIREKYIDALIGEIKLRSKIAKDKEVISIFIGGGTPSILKSEEILRIMDAVRDNYALSDDCEISMEVNPGTDVAFKAIKEAGINRISIGLQSASDEELKILGRIHNLKDFEYAYEQVLFNGISNINTDLMSALPSQNVESYKRSLDYVLSLKERPKHISAYSLIVEEGTPFYDMVLDLPGEEDERKMYKITRDILRNAGYERYEISNYSLPGYQCRHNTVYWERGEYIGLGLGASSFYDKCRFKNVSDINKYLITPDFKYEEEISLTKEDEMEEFMFLGLRMMKGVSEDDFITYFKEPFPERFNEVIDKYRKSGHLNVRDGRIMLTDSGIDVSNRIFADFLFD